MKAMIMAAGVGSRLMPMTINIPKPMIPLANRPLMENTVRLLADHGLKHIVANLHYNADVISNYFTNGHNLGVEMEYSREEELMGTAGGVKKCEWFLNDTFVIVSGDALTDVDLTALISAHKRKGALATIALKKVEDVQHFGVVITDDTGLIKSFQEKPRPEEALSNMANTGIYVFEPEIFKYIPIQQFYDFGKQVFPDLVQQRAPFYGVEIDQYWCDVGNLDTYRQAHADVLEGRVAVYKSGQLSSPNSKTKALLDQGINLGKNVNFQGSVVIGPGCRIGDNVTISNSVIWGNTVIEDDVKINEAIVGSTCRLGKGAIINSGAAVASGCQIGNKIEIPANSKVSPPPTERI